MPKGGEDQAPAFTPSWTLPAPRGWEVQGPEAFDGDRQAYVLELFSNRRELLEAD